MTSQPANKYRDACFTSYLETKPEQGKGVTYLVFQKEKCPTTGKEHWQGFAQSKNQKTTKAWQKALKIGKAHVEQRQGTCQEAADYCKAAQWKDKDKGQVPGTTEEFGEFDPKDSQGQGKRNDLDEIKTKLDAGFDPDDLMEDDDHFRAFARNDKFLRQYASHVKRRKRFSPPHIVVLFGPTGTNKTRRFYDSITNDKGEYGPHWKWHPGMTPWFDGYHGQQDVLFDEFRSGGLSYGLLLEVTDGYPVKLPVKGGFINWAPTHITFTSPVHPREWYPNLAANDKLDQLLRRINKVIDTATGKEIDLF